MEISKIDLTSSRKLVNTLRKDLEAKLGMPVFIEEVYTLTSRVPDWRIVTNVKYLVKSQVNCQERYFLGKSSLSREEALKQLGM